MRPTLPPEVEARISVIDEGPTDITMDDLDTLRCGEENQEMVEALCEILIKWNNLPIIEDDFESPRERREWKDGFKDMPEIKEFLEANRIRGNEMSRVFGAIWPLLDLDVFSAKEKERLYNEAVELKDVLGIINHLNTDVFRFASQVNAVLDEAQMHEYADEDGRKPANELIGDIRYSVMRRLESISLEILEKFVDKDKREQRKMREAAERAAASTSEESEYRDMALIGGPGLELLAVILDKIEAARKAARRILAKRKKK